MKRILSMLIAAIMVLSAMTFAAPAGATAAGHTLDAHNVAVDVPYFSGTTNFYEITGPDEVLLLTYERGVEDFTYACGTGTGSAAAVLFTRGLISGRGTRFSMRGGVLTMDVLHDEKGRITDLYLTGPTNIVAKGEITDEELSF